MARIRFKARPLSTRADRKRVLITPEGVDLSVEIATYSQRATAFLLDLMFVTLAMGVIGIVSFFGLGFTIGALGPHGGRLPAIFTFILLLLGFFVLRNFYFLYFELGPRGATPGKRIAHIRVMAASGGALTAESVFARNAMRDLEVVLPAVFLLVHPGGIDGLLSLLGTIWTGVFVVFPLFNRDRMRIGDVVGGTWVVVERLGGLKADLTQDADILVDRHDLVFSAEQLAAYGVKELQLLETVLRRKNGSVMRDVAARIRNRIGWTPSAAENDFEFLDAYYKALRGRLEAEILFGRRQADKYDRAGMSGG